jgi:glycosyltransferase involved in cell wall biosynthesis
MRICYLTNSAIPSTVASSIQIVKMCEAFSELNNEVILITTNVSKKKQDLFDYYDVKFKFIFKKIKYFKTFPLGFRYYIFSIFSILESLKHKPDIYITRNFFTCFLLVMFRKRIIMELHQDLNIESRIVNFLTKKLKFLNSKYVKKIVAITEGVKNEYVKKNIILENKITVLPSGSSVKSKFYFLNKKKFFNIGYFGSLYRSRGLNLIKKLAKIDNKNQYHLYGDLYKINNFKFTNTSNNIHLHNHIPYKDIPKNLSKMDILLMPYVSNVTIAGDVGDITRFTSPLKLFDYLSAGKIIMCSDLDVLKEIIKDNKNAIFIKNFKNIFSWKKEILKLSNQPQKQYIMSKNNYNLSKNYSLKERAKKIIEMIN